MVAKLGLQTISNQSRRAFLATAAAGLGALLTAQSTPARPDIVRPDFSAPPTYGNGTIPVERRRFLSCNSGRVAGSSVFFRGIDRA
jgi:hypothetical protein